MPIALKMNGLIAECGFDDEGLERLIGLEIEGVRKLRESDVKAIRISALNGLCRTFGCRPGDILDYVLDEE